MANCTIGRGLLKEVWPVWFRDIASHASSQKCSYSHFAAQIAQVRPPVIQLSVKEYACILTADRVRPIMTDSPNPEGFGPKPWGLLDFQDVAIFVWPTQREFEIQEQCLILQHRNAKLKDLTPEELIEIRGWISRSYTIDAEGQKVDLRAWRRGLKYKDLKKLVKRMEADLKWARRIKEDLEREEERRSQKVSVKEKREKVVDPSPSRRRRKFVIEDSDEE